MTSLVSLVRSDGVAVLTLDDPRHRNVLSPKMIAEISAAVDDAEADQTVNALILTGRGTAFCAGAELRTLEDAARGDFGLIRNVYTGFLRVLNSRLLTVAAVNGPAVGAGFNLALACDLRLASPGARFESRFPRLRIFPGGGHTFMLTRAVGYQQAVLACLLGAAWDAEEALQRGLVIEVAEPDGLVGRAREIIRRVGDQDPEYVARLLSTLRTSSTAQSHAKALEDEAAWQEWSTRQPAFLAGLEDIRQAIARRSS